MSCPLEGQVLCKGRWQYHTNCRFTWHEARLVSGSRATKRSLVMAVMGQDNKQAEMYKKLRKVGKTQKGVAGVG